MNQGQPLSPSGKSDNSASQGAVSSLTQVTSALKIPRLKINLQNVEALYFVTSNNLMEFETSNVFATAALLRAVNLARAGQSACQLRALNHVQIANFANASRFFKNTDLFPDIASKNVLLLSSATLYEREYKFLLGLFAHAEAKLTTTFNLASDDIPYGKREDPEIPFAADIIPLVRESKDPLVRKLMELALASENLTAENALSMPIEILDIYKALKSLRQQCGIFSIREKSKYDLFESLAAITSALAESGTSAIAAELLEDLNDNYTFAENIWSNAKEIAPNIFVTEEIPWTENTSLFRLCFRETYERDQRAHFVLEHAIDRPANKINYEEAIEFKRRLSVGGDAAEILEEVKSLLQERDDSGTLMHIYLYEGREREPKDILEPLLDKAEYLCDAEGQYIFLKTPENFDAFAELEKADIPLITHSVFWLLDLKTGSSKPSHVCFQAKHLQAVLELLN